MGSLEIIKKLDQEIEAPADFTSPEKLYQELIAGIRKYHPSDDITMIEKAYRVAKRLIPEILRTVSQMAGSLSIVWHWMPTTMRVSSLQRIPAAFHPSFTTESPQPVSVLFKVGKYGCFGNWIKLFFVA